MVLLGSTLISCSDEMTEEVFDDMELSTNDPDEDPGGDPGN